MTTSKLPALVVLSLGALLTCLGGLALGPGRAAAKREGEAVASTPLLRADTAVGTRVLAEGQLGGLGEAPHGLSLYVLSEYVGTERDGPNRGRSRWREVARQVAAFPLQLPDGRSVQVSASPADTVLQLPPHELSADGGVLGPAPLIAPGVLEQGPRRVQGFAPGDLVTVDGVRTEGPGLRASVVYGGPAGAYREGRREEATVPLVVGALFVGLGLMALAVGRWLLGRSRRS